MSIPARVVCVAKASFLSRFGTRSASPVAAAPVVVVAAAAALADALAGSSIAWRLGVGFLGEWSASGAAVVGATPSLLRRSGGLCAFRLNDSMGCHAMYVYPHGMAWMASMYVCMYGYIQVA